jgi:putative transposase
MRGNSSRSRPCSHGLPHIDGSGLTQFITYRIFDALPAGANTTERDFDLAAHDAIADEGHGSCLLARPECAAIVVEQWRYHEVERYELLAWVVMPNHVHVLIRPRVGIPLAKIVQSWKARTARRINDVLGRSGPVWQSDYFDHYLRERDSDESFIAYIHDNPVKAGLAQRPEEWRWSSAWEG